MNHYHLDVLEPDGKKRVGALASTLGAAEMEKGIEEAGDARRQVEVRPCDKDCFGKRLQAA